MFFEPTVDWTWALPRRGEVVLQPPGGTALLLGRTQADAFFVAVRPHH